MKPKKIKENVYWLGATDAKLCQQIVSEAHDAIIVADREGIIRLWNTGAETIFGFSPAAALGQSLHLIIPEKLRERHDQGYQQVMQSGRSKYATELLAVPAIKKDGSRISVEFTMIVLRDGQDEILGAAAIIRDVTARWEKDRALQRRLAALEAQLAQYLQA
ncbi:MAG: PAS domain S-box protein [Desulfobacterota bacterium]|nr:PAS domain S-box protein [Thermodesulfobacteriota bacterium]